VVEGVEDAVGGALDAAAEAVVAAFVVVVAHVVSVRFVGGVDVFFGDFNVVVGSLAAVFDFVGWVGTAAVFALGDVDLRFEGLGSGVAAVDLDVDPVVFCWTSVAEELSDESWEGKVLEILTVRV
jgi:hypothetical protein